MKKKTEPTIATNNAIISRALFFIFRFLVLAMFYHHFVIYTLLFAFNTGRDPIFAETLPFIELIPKIPSVYSVLIPPRYNNLFVAIF